MTDLDALRDAAVESLRGLGPDAELDASSPAGLELPALAFAEASDDVQAATWRGLLRGVREDSVVPVDTLLAWIRPRTVRLTLAEFRALAPKRGRRKATRDIRKQRVLAAKVGLATSNRKLGPQVVNRHVGGRDGWSPVAPFVMTTTAPIEQSCPTTCPFFEKRGKTRPCYADSGFTRFGVARLERAAAGMTPEQIALDEAMELDATFPDGIPQDNARGGRDLRLHVAGDCRTAKAARILGDAVTRFRRRGGGSVWTYTHAWRTVPREAWGKDIAVHASCETIEEVAQAATRGYGAAMVVGEHDGPHARKIGNYRVLPCVAETRDTTCAECRICLDRDLLRLRLVIAFAAHGAGATEVKRRIQLKVIP